MTSLSNKHVLVAGDGHEKLSLLTSELQTRGLQIHTALCAEVNADYIKEHQIELIIFNHLQDETVCDNMLDIMHSKDLHVAVPVFALIKDTPEAVQEALDRGAADYISVHEELDSILQKFEAVFSEGDLFSGSQDIDISPIEAAINSTGIRVYVVEDDPLLRNLLSIRLEKSSFPFEFSSDGRDVVPVMKHFKPDVIILDVMLPGKSGFDVLAEVKADEVLSKVPVIVFSNRDSADDRSRAKDLGADCFFVKAMTDLSELIEKIEFLTKR